MPTATILHITLHHAVPTLQHAIPRHIKHSQALLQVPYQTRSLMPRHAAACHAMPCHAVPHHALQYDATQRNAMQYSAMLRRVMSHHVTSHGRAPTCPLPTVRHCIGYDLGNASGVSIEGWHRGRASRCASGVCRCASGVRVGGCSTGRA